MRALIPAMILVLQLAVGLASFARAAEDENEASPETAPSAEPSAPKPPQNPAKADFRVICRAYQTAYWKLTHKGADKAKVAYEMAQEVARRITTPAAKSTWTAHLNADKPRKILELGARQAGLKDWKCPAVDSYRAVLGK